MSICNDSNSGILSINNPAPVRWNMGQGVPGSLDGLYLYPSGASSWKAQPNNVPLKKGKFFVPQGTPIPLRCESVYQTLPKNSMFYFARNYSSPLCSSTYSTYGGQVCTTPAQRSLIAPFRGGGKPYTNYGF